MMKSIGKLTQCIHRIASGCFRSRRIGIDGDIVSFIVARTHGISAALYLIVRAGPYQKVTAINGIWPSKKRGRSTLPGPAARSLVATAKLAESYATRPG